LLSSLYKRLFQNKMTTTEDMTAAVSEEKNAGGTVEELDEREDSENQPTVQNPATDITQEQVDKLKSRVEKLENILNVEIKTLCERGDLSAFNKVNMIMEIIASSSEKKAEKVEEKAKEKDEEKAKEKEEEKEEGVNGKRPANTDDSEGPEVKMAKSEEVKGINENKENVDEKTKEKDEGEDSDEEGKDIDSCVVCGLYLSVFKEDSSKELHHYLSHGFNILKEFEILKPDDSLFLVCNICGSPFPRKCHGNYRKHLVTEHQERIIEIFREF